MLVNYDGSRVKLAGEYSPHDTTNSVQRAIQPPSQQAKPKNTETAAGTASAPPVQDSGTPKVHNPTLARMGIQMPEPRPPTVTSTKLSQLRLAIKKANLNEDLNLVRKVEERDPLLVQSLERRERWDSPYLSDKVHADLALRDTPHNSSYHRNKGRIYGGVGAAIGGTIPLLLASRSKAGILGKILSAGAGAIGGYAAGKAYNNYDTRNHLKGYQFFLRSQNDL